MYLFSFVFMLLVIIGIFSGVNILQQERIAGNETVVGRSFYDWHSQVVSAVLPNRANIPPGICRYSTGAYLYGTTPPAAAACVVGTLGTPPTNVMAFESVLYRAGTPENFYVVTFIPPGATADAPRPPTGHTMTQYYQQLQRAVPVGTTNFGLVEQVQIASGPPPVTQCQVRRTMATGGTPATINVTYLLPNCANVPAGSLAIFTIL